MSLDQPGRYSAEEFLLAARARETAEEVEVVPPGQQQAHSQDCLLASNCHRAVDFLVWRDGLGTAGPLRTVQPTRLPHALSTGTAGQLVGRLTVRSGTDGDPGRA